MKPRERFLSGLSDHLVPFFQDIGFRFRASKLEFERVTVGGVHHFVRFQLSRANRGDTCEFWSAWEASNAEYSRWHLRTWGSAANSDSLGGLVEWNIPGWSRSATDHFALSNAPSDARKWQQLRMDISNVGLPFLDRISTWTGAAAELRSKRWMFDRASDFLMIAGERESAREVLLEGLRTFTTEGRIDSFRELPRIRQRWERYFGDPSPVAPPVAPNDQAADAQPAREPASRIEVRTDDE